MINKVILVGNLGKDAESLKLKDSDYYVIKFSLATTDKSRDKEETEWHNVSFFSKSNSITQYLLKGTTVYLEGKIKTEEYEDRDGVKRKQVKIITNHIKLISGAKKDNPQSQNNTTPSQDYQPQGMYSQPQQAIPPTGMIDDDLPF